MKWMKYLLGLGLATLLVACSHQRQEPNSSQTTTSTQPAVTQANSEASHAIVITINGQDYPASLDDSQASQSLLEQLPLEQSFRDFSAGYDEKITDLEGTLDFQSEQHSHDPQAGDIAYWSPDHRLVFYWGDVGEYSGIQVMGRFDNDQALEAIRGLQPSDRVVIRQAD